MEYFQQTVLHFLIYQVLFGGKLMVGPLYQIKQQQLLNKLIFKKDLMLLITYQMQVNINLVNYGELIQLVIHIQEQELMEMNLQEI